VESGLKGLRDIPRRGRPQCGTAIVSVLKYFKDKLMRYSKGALLKLLHMLPVSSAFVGPPRRFASETPNWVKKWNSRNVKAKASCEIIHAPSNICRSEPSTIYRSDAWQYQIWRQSQAVSTPPSESPATFFSTIPNARVFGADGCVIAPDDALLGDVSLDIDTVIAGDGGSNSVFQRLKLPALTYLKGEALLLTSLGGHNYFHWMFQVLPRLVLMEKAGVKLKGIETFFINKILAQFQTETLEKLNVPVSRVLQCRPDTHIQVDRLLLPSRPSRMSEMPLWVCEFLRETFLPDKSALNAGRNGHKRIYVSRGDAQYRKVVHESELEAYLQGLGFETVVLGALTVAEQAATFQSAEIIIAPHGAGLTNLVFCNPGTLIIEIFAPSYINCCYWALSNWIGARYWFILGSGECVRDDMWGMGDDIYVDDNTFRKVLEASGVL